MTPSAFPMLSQPPDPSLVVYLSLDSLGDETWQPFGLSKEDMSHLRPAARAAVEAVNPAYGTASSQLLDLCLGALRGRDTDAARQKHSARTLHSFAENPSLTPLGRWHQFFKDKAMPDMEEDAGNWLENARAAFKEHDNGTYRSYMTALIDTVPGRMLSDWDLHVHTTQRICYMTSEHFEKPAIFVHLALNQALYAFARFAATLVEDTNPAFLEAARQQIALGLNRDHATAKAAEDWPRTPKVPDSPETALPLRECLTWL